MCQSVRVRPIRFQIGAQRLLRCGRMQSTVEFQGGVFSAEIEGGRAGATVSLAAGAVVAVTAEGHFFRVPFGECQLEHGGASGRMWFCRTRDRSLTIFCEAPGFVEALAMAARRELGPELDRLLGAKRASSRRGFWIGAAVLVAVAVLGFGAYLGLKQAGRASIKLLPHSVDKQLGDLALENMNLGGPVLTDSVLTGAIDEMVKRLAKQGGHGFTFRVQVVDSTTVNAFALPGGAIVVYTGLLRSATSPEQVAGVLAHEIAHVTRRHGMERIAQSIGVIASLQLLFGDVTGLAAVAAEVLREGAINSYGRDQEHQADMDGVKTLARASIDPRSLADFFVLLKKEEAGSINLPAFLATHPDLDQRIKDVRTAAKRSGFAQAKPFALSWPDVQKHAGLAK